ncbi:hypothetical protein HN51_050657 [Arachis hypogaea]
MQRTPKVFQISTLRSSSSNPTLTQTKQPASSSSTKNAKQITSTGVASVLQLENLYLRSKLLQLALHLSMNLVQRYHDPVPHNTVEKSLIMQKIGDKDIVRRAFKTFQNNYNQPNYLI